MSTRARIVCCAVADPWRLVARATSVTTFSRDTVVAIRHMGRVSWWGEGRPYPTTLTEYRAVEALIVAYLHTVAYVGSSLFTPPIARATRYRCIAWTAWHERLGRTAMDVRWRPLLVRKTKTRRIPLAQRHLWENFFFFFSLWSPFVS